MSDFPPFDKSGEELAGLGAELAEDAVGLIAGLLHDLTDAIRLSGGMSRAEARRNGPEVLRARYRRERLARQYRQAERAAYRGERPPTARQALGHGGPEDVLPRVSVYVADPARVLIDVEVDRRTAHRVGTYIEATRRLLDGRLSPTAFDRRFKRWAPVRVFSPDVVAGTYAFASAAEVLALASTIGPDVELIFDSGRRRPRRQRTGSGRRSRR